MSSSAGAFLNVKLPSPLDAVELIDFKSSAITFILPDEVVTSILSHAPFASISTEPDEAVSLASVTIQSTSISPDETVISSLSTSKSVPEKSPDEDTNSSSLSFTSFGIEISSFLLRLFKSRFFADSAYRTYSVLPSTHV